MFKLSRTKLYQWGALYPMATSLVLACAVLSGCSKEADKAKPAGTAPKAKDAHNHDHDSQPGHSHDDGHDHDHSHDDEPGHSHDDGHDHDHGDEEAGTVAVPIPQQVRQNLGITFVTAEQRSVTETIRVPGRFEALPSASREYHAPVAGRVELLVNQYDKVTTGTPLYRLDSGEWRRMQQELLTIEAEVAASSASLMTAQVAREGGEAARGVTRQRIAAADEHIENLEESVRLAEEREKQVLRLQDIVGGRMADVNEARSQLASLRNELSQAREDRAELEQTRLQLSTDTTGSSFGTSETLKATLLARRAEYESAKARRDLLKASLLSIMGDSASPLSAGANTLWQPVPEITVKASAEGIVNEVAATSGGYVDANAQIMSVHNPGVLRFRAVALQSDIDRLQDTMPGRLLAPGGQANRAHIPVNVTLAVEADAEERTFDLVANVAADYPWVRKGLSTDLELNVEDSGTSSVAVPDSAIIQDGLEKVVFRRNPANRDEAHRVPVLLGTSDGRWTTITEGVNAGDELVLHGVYELKLATAAAPAKAGHFHADGTFHEGDH